MLQETQSDGIHWKKKTVALVSNDGSSPVSSFLFNSSEYIYKETKMVHIGAISASNVGSAGDLYRGTAVTNQ